MKYIAIIYSWTLAKLPLSHPLFGVKYIGQSIRGRHKYPTPHAVLSKRTKEHVANIKTADSTIGLYAAVRRFGIKAFVLDVEETNCGEQEEMQKWANDREAEWIADEGGVCRDMNPERAIEQTLNLTKGGQGAQFCANIAKSNHYMEVFAEHLREYMLLHPERGANPRIDHTTTCGYNLGEVTHRVRKRDFLDPKWYAILDALPGWTWNGRKTAIRKKEFKDAVNRGIEQAGGQSAITKRQHQKPERYEKYKVTRRENTLRRRELHRATLNESERLIYDRSCAANDQKIKKGQDIRAGIRRPNHRERALLNRAAIRETLSEKEKAKYDKQCAAADRRVVKARLERQRARELSSA